MQLFIQNQLLSGSFVEHSTDINFIFVFQKALNFLYFSFFSFVFHCISNRNFTLYGGHIVFMQMRSGHTWLIFIPMDFSNGETYI